MYDFNRIEKGHYKKLNHINSLILELFKTRYRRNYKVIYAGSGDERVEAQVILGQALQSAIKSKSTIKYKQYLKTYRLLVSVLRERIMYEKLVYTRSALDIALGIE